VAAESKDPNSVLQFYKQVLKLRHTNQALLYGTYTAINEDDPNVLSYLRVYNGQGVVVVLNMSNVPRNVTLPLKANGFSSARNLISTGVAAPRTGKLSLPAFGAFIGELCVKSAPTARQ
jgi:glycosidase